MTRDKVQESWRRQSGVAWRQATRSMGIRARCSRRRSNHDHHCAQRVSRHQPITSAAVPSARLQRRGCPPPGCPGDGTLGTSDRRRSTAQRLIQERKTNPHLHSHLALPWPGPVLRRSGTDSAVDGAVGAAPPRGARIARAVLHPCVRQSRVTNRNSATHFDCQGSITLASKAKAGGQRLCEA